MKITIENTCAIKGALMLVLGTPEFEGLPCIEGRIEKEGLLIEN